MITITVDDRVFQRSVRGYAEYLRGTRSVMIVIGRGLRDFTKDTIRMGGRPEAPWAPLSPWTIRRVGRTKPLNGLQTRIRYRSTSNFAELYEAEDGFAEWDATQHHFGYVTPARSAVNAKVMRVPQGTKAAYFKHAGPSVVPARPFWPNWNQTEDVSRSSVEKWVSEGARRKWR